MLLNNLRVVSFHFPHLIIWAKALRLLQDSLKLSVFGTLSIQWILLHKSCKVGNDWFFSFFLFNLEDWLLSFLALVALWRLWILRVLSETLKVQNVIVWISHQMSWRGLILVELSVDLGGLFWQAIWIEAELIWRCAQHCASKVSWSYGGVKFRQVRHFAHEWFRKFLQLNFFFSPRCWGELNHGSLDRAEQTNFWCLLIILWRSPSRLVHLRHIQQPFLEIVVSLILLVDT